jgi:23S rRNA pseudouridine1911/1915/1917 synthase
MYHWQKKGWQRTFHAVNRLDKDTSGLVLLAQNRFSHQQLSIQQKSHQLERKYYAWVHGQVAEDEGVIEAPIGRKDDSIITREVRSDGQYAKTYFQVINRFPTYTWVELKLATGRTHQIRVHMSDMGHPLLGDDMYGGKRQLIARQALHAYYTSFTHPESGKMVTFQADLPQDLQELITN